MGLRETRRPFVSSVEVVSVWRLKRSVGVRLLFCLSMQDLVTGRGLQATQPSQVHRCLFPLQQLLALRREAGTESPYQSEKVRCVIKKKERRTTKTCAGK